MNKSQLIDKIADGADISKAAAGRALGAVLSRHLPDADQLYLRD